MGRGEDLLKDGMLFLLLVLKLGGGRMVDMVEEVTFRWTVGRRLAWLGGSGLLGVSVGPSNGVGLKDSRMIAGEEGAGGDFIG